MTELNTPIPLTNDGGLTKIILQAGKENTHPPHASKVKVHYTGRLHEDTDPNKKQFDSSRDRGDPFSFDLGKGSVIKGWDLGVATMNIGERALLIIKPEYGYGATGAGGDIPPNATLEFDVELLSFVEGEPVTDDGQVTKVVLEKGTGYEHPKDGEDVTVIFQGALGDGTVVDGSDREVTLPLTSANFNPGLLESIKKMTKGEHARVTVRAPHHGNVNLPEGGHIIYDVKLISWIERVKVNDSDGLIKYILNEGSQWTKPNYGATCTIDLLGKDQAGNVFDKREDLTLVIEDGTDTVPEFIEDTLRTMKKLERASLHVNPENIRVLPEGAPKNEKLIYEITLKDFTKGVESYELKDAAAKLAHANKLKDIGGLYFKKNSLDRAHQLYSRAFKVIESKSDFTQPEDQQAADKAKVALHLNLAIVDHKRGKHGAATEQCSKALAIEPNSVKALYRRGVSYQNRAEFDLAKQDFKKALEIEPQNQSVLQELATLDAKIKEQNKKDKQLFGKMFQ